MHQSAENFTLDEEDPAPRGPIQDGCAHEFMCIAVHLHWFVYMPYVSTHFAVLEDRGAWLEDSLPQQNSSLRQSSV
jgi:hypothetical protein